MVKIQYVTDMVNEIWYQYAEGFLPQLTGTVSDDRLYRLIDDKLPPGWTASIQPSGSVYASKPIWVDQSMRVFVIEKRADGRSRTFEIVL